MFEKTITRLRRYGLANTVSYSLFVYLLPKIGAEVKHGYVMDEAPSDDPPRHSQQTRVQLVRNVSEFIPTDVSAMLSFEGKNLMDRAAADFSKGNWCVVSRNPSGAFLGLFWCEPSRDSAGRTEEILIRDAFIVPEARGHGYFSELVRTGCRCVRDERPGESVTFTANVFAGNISSTRGFLAAGFIYSHTTVRLFRRFERVLRKRSRRSTRS